MTRKEIVKFLRGLAEIDGLKALAKETGLNRVTLYRTLNPTDGNPSLRNFLRICQALDVEITVEAKARRVRQ